MRVVVGGTFAYLHKGHMALLSKAFEIGDYVYIGLTTDEYVRRTKNRCGVPDYSSRERALREFVRGLGKRFDIVPLNDRFGPAATGNFDAIVVSEETFPIAQEINQLRRASKLTPLSVIRIDYVLAFDSAPISASRIIKGEIDRDGHRADEA